MMQVAGMSKLREACVIISLIGGGSGCLLAYLAATGETQGPIYSGWMTLFLVTAVLACVLGGLGGALVFIAARLAAAMLVVAALGYAGVLFLMLLRYEPDPFIAALFTAGPITGLFLAGAVLAGLVGIRQAPGEWSD